LDTHTDAIQQAKRALFAGALPQSPKDMRAPVTNGDGTIATFLPTIFRARSVDIDGKNYGHLRIFTLNVNDPQVFVEEFVRLLESLPMTGLVLDVRGNGGGHIHAAERILQTLSDRHIEPERAQFINSPLNLQLCREHGPSKTFAGLDLHPWVASIAQSIQTWATYSLGFPITPPDACNDVGRRYLGRCVLVTDALCYSATDIFAAGFQDHAIGRVLGIHQNTGAGGANVWTHGLLRRLIDKPQYQPLPRGADLRVAIRRTMRVGQNAGGIVESLGIQPDDVYQMQQDDVLCGNEGVLRRAVQLLEHA
jgi:hypothetical protein